MNESRWKEVDEYLSSTLLPPDDVLSATLKACDDAGLPQISVSPTQGKMLWMLAKMKGAKHILEIGTLGGYSTIWLARALPDNGTLISLESNRAHHEVAISNLINAGLKDKVTVLLGRARDQLQRLDALGIKPFDLIFIDADKPSNPEYLSWALKLALPGCVIVIDNVVRNGQVLDAQSTDPGVQGTRTLIEMLAAEPRLSATAMQTVGSKGYDGFAIAIVTK